MESHEVVAVLVVLLQFMMTILAVVAYALELGPHSWPRHVQGLRLTQSQPVPGMNRRMTTYDNGVILGLYWG